MIEEGGTTSYQCPDCGQARTGEECGVCTMAMRLLREHKGEHGATGCALCCFSLIINFQKARAQEAEARIKGQRDFVVQSVELQAEYWNRADKAEARVKELEGAIERHKGHELAIGNFVDPYDIELWAALEPPRGDTEER